MPSHTVKKRKAAAKKKRKSNTDHNTSHTAARTIRQMNKRKDGGATFK